MVVVLLAVFQCFKSVFLHFFLFHYLLSSLNVFVVSFLFQTWITRFSRSGALETKELSLRSRLLVNLHLTGVKHQNLFR